MQDLFSNWTGRDDHEDGGLQWHHIIQDIEEDNSGKDRDKIALLGFCSDEGVRRNKGRVGAARGPEAIRRACANLPNHFPEGTLLFEAGDIHPEGKPLINAQEKLGERVAELLRDGYFPIVFGGGHEVAWGTYSGVVKVTPPAKAIGIINVDAHFDIRKPVDGPTSGTGFYQIAQERRAAGQDFHYLCLGIQPHANTQALFRRADEWNVEYFPAYVLEAHRLDPIFETVEAFLEKVDSIYLSIDMDAFDATYAPGVSAPNTLGLDPRHILPLLQEILYSQKVAAMDIAEVNPEYDIDGRTAKLAAALTFELLRAKIGDGEFLPKGPAPKR